MRRVPPRISLLSILRAYWLPFFIAVAGSAGSIAAGMAFRARDAELDRERFDQALKQVVIRIENVVEAHQRGLQMLADAVGAREEMTEGHWRLQMDRMKFGLDYAGVYEVGLVDVALATNLPPELARTRLNDLDSKDPAAKTAARQTRKFLLATPLTLKPSFHFCPRREDEVPARPGPIVDDHKLIGAAISGQWPRMTGRRAISTSKKGEDIFGTTMLLGVPTEEMALEWSPGMSAAQDRLQNKGSFDMWNYRNPYLKKRYGTSFVYASIQWQSLADLIFSGSPRDLNFRLYSEELPRAESFLAEVGQKRGEAKNKRDALLRMYGKRWLISAESTPVFEARSTLYRGPLTMGVGSFLSCLTAASLAIQVHARRAQEQISDALRAARDERVKLGRDLHDGAIQSLYALQLGLNRLAHKAGSDAKVAGQIDDATQTLQGVIAELRGFILDHEAERPAPTNLERVLLAMVERLRKTTDVPIELDCEPGCSQELSQAQAIELAHVAREAISNSMRHAHATAISVRLRRSASGVELRIADNGRGFDAKSVRDGALGLASMRLRALEAGGEFDLQSTAQGTSVRVPIALHS